MANTPEIQRDAASPTRRRGRVGTKHQELSVALRALTETLRPGDRLPTQEELMRRYGVSDTTVLRALEDLKQEGRIVRRQGSGTFVADGAAAVPPPAAETPKRAARGMVALLSRPSSMPFYSDLMQSVEANLRENGLAPVLVLDADVDRRVQRARDHWTHGEILGAIHVGSAVLEDTGDLPIIQLGETTQNGDFAQVSVDNFGAGARVGDYLWDLGHRRIGVVTVKGARTQDPVQRQGVDRLRVTGLRARWEERGGVWNEDWQVAHPFLLLPGDLHAVDMMRSYLLPLFAAADHPTALFAAHDEMATVAIRALEKMGMTVPDDVSVIGFNDSGTLAAYFRPSLTTVRTPSPALGTLAVHLLLDLLRHPQEKPRSVRLPADIIVRESTAPYLPELPDRTPALAAAHLEQN